MDLAPTTASLPPMAPQPAALARQLDRLARRAEPAWLHGEVARRLGDKLQAILLEPAHWVDWSGWLGQGADVVGQRYPQAQRWVHEPHAELQARSRAQWLADHPTPWWARWKKVRPPVFGAWPVEAADWPEEGAGLVWANMVLHASPSLPTLFEGWHRMLKVDGFVMCSGLGPDTARELRDLYRALGWGLPTIDFIDMHDLGDAMVQAGFADPVMDMERLTLTWADASAMLDELSTWGGNVAVGRFAGLRTPRWRQALLDGIQQRLMRPDGRVGLTLELVYGHAVKPRPKALVQPETKVSLDDMRRMIRQSGPGGR